MKYYYHHYLIDENTINRIKGTQHFASDFLTDMLNSYTKKWNNKIFNKVDELSNKIEKFPKFSDNFQQAIGKHNYRHILGIDDVVILESFIYSYLEYIIKVESENPRNLFLLCILEANKITYCDYPLVRSNIMNVGLLPENYRLAQYGIVRFLTEVYNIPMLNSISTLAFFTEINVESFFNVNKFRHLNNKEIDRYRFYISPDDIIKFDFQKRYDIEELANIPNFQVKSDITNTYIKFADLFIKDEKKRKTLGGACLYQNNDDIFAIPATPCYSNDDALNIGTLTPHALFMNQNLLSIYPRQRVIFFQDLRAAITLENYLYKYSKYDPHDFIITAPIGNELDVLPWNYFHFHDILFVPAPSKLHMSMLPEYESYFHEQRSRSFKISNKLFLFANPSTYNWREIPTQDS